MNVNNVWKFPPLIKKGFYSLIQSRLCCMDSAKPVLNIQPVTVLSNFALINFSTSHSILHPVISRDFMICFGLSFEEGCL